MVDSATGTLKDNQKKSYVKSPSRGGAETAQEVLIGNEKVQINTDINDALKNITEVLMRIEFLLKSINQ